jgi:hypothetical protein
MNYLNYKIVNGAITPGSQATIDEFCLFTPTGAIWALNGPPAPLNFLCAILVAWCSQAAGYVMYDPRPLNTISGPVNLSAWGTAVVQPDGRYAIQLP